MPKSLYALGGTPLFGPGFEGGIGASALVIGSFSPTGGGVVDVFGSASFTVTDTASLLRVFVFATYPPTGAVELVFDGASFAPGYGSSTLSALGNGDAFTLIRTGGWAARSVVFTVDAIDIAGTEARTTYSLTVPNGPLPDVASPTITNFSPAPETLIAASDLIAFDVTDDSGLFRRVIVIASYVTTGGAELVHDGTSFRGNFARQSSRAAIVLGYHYLVGRFGGWPAPPTLEIYAIDRSGHEG